ncbi:hypothetical protein AVEN_106323-1 [Araneus ventricosus]|uniref:Uncharacterized protein n=1 Tax=Araneus ventricosus TaxID=182803 RepID=A0A4Y2ATE8_ARAVE|nr:hypothetical protein AVEN_106323-1 [Araneus ventricosus]
MITICNFHQWFCFLVTRASPKCPSDKIFTVKYESHDSPQLIVKPLYSNVSHVKNLAILLFSSASFVLYDLQLRCQPIRRYGRGDAVPAVERTWLRSRKTYLSQPDFTEDLQCLWSGAR